MNVKITSQELKERGWYRQKTRRIYEIWWRGPEYVYFDPVAEKIIAFYSDANDDLAEATKQ